MMHHLPEIIWWGFVGLVIGNFTTSPLYRLPRAVPLFGEDPYCDKCHAKLKPRDLFPVFSWLSTRGRCRYCAAPIPGIYTLVEAAVCTIFVLCFLQYGATEKFILLSFGMTTLVMLSAMLMTESFFSDRTLLVSMVIGALYRTLAEGTIYGFAGGAFAGLFIGALAWKFSGGNMKREVGFYPTYMKLLMLAGVWLTFPQFLMLLVGVVIALPLRRLQVWFIDWTILGFTLLELLIRTSH